MLEAIVEAGSKRPVWFIHGARNRRDQIMGAFARRIATQVARAQETGRIHDLLAACSHP